MKKPAILLVFLVFTCMSLSAQIQNPSFFKAENPNLSLLSIEVKPAETEILFRYQAPSLYEGASWLNVKKEIYIRDCATQKKYALLRASNIPLAPYVHNFSREGEVLDFSLSFEPLPAGVEEIDIVEEASQGACTFYRVRLSDSLPPSVQMEDGCIPKDSSISNNFYKKETYTLDTLFYDGEGKGVPHQLFADYYRLKLTPKGEYQYKKFKDFYASGELRAEGGYTYIDSSDDANTLFDGDFRLYAPSGALLEKCTYLNGVLEGDYYSYYEGTGLLFKHMRYEDGKINGLYTEFSEEGNSCIQLEYIEGVPNTYYIESTSEGYASKFNLSNNMPIWELPTKEDRKVETEEGLEWSSYNLNGLTVALNYSRVRSYGIYYKLSMIIANNSVLPIEFNPEEMHAFIKDKKGRGYELEVFKCDEYMSKVKSTQNFLIVLTAVAEIMSASSAGYTTETISTTTYHETGERDRARGSSQDGRHSTTTTKVVNYDALAAYQAQQIAISRTVDFSLSLLYKRAVLEEGYFKKTTLYPGEVIRGYVLVERERGKQLEVFVPINGIKYPFEWELK